MDKIRIGNDVVYEWVILRRDKYIEDFSTAKIIELKLSNDSIGETYYPLYEIRDNVITVYFPASAQINCGTHSLHINYTKEDAEFTVDYEGAFELVAQTSEESAPSPDDGKVTSYIYRNSDGLNGYTPEIGSNGNWFINKIDTGKTSTGAPFTHEMFTEEQILDIKKPALDAADLVHAVIESSEEATFNCLEATDAVKVVTADGKETIKNTLVSASTALAAAKKAEDVIEIAEGVIDTVNEQEAERIVSEDTRKANEAVRIQSDAVRDEKIEAISDRVVVYTSGTDDDDNLTVTLTDNVIKAEFTESFVATLNDKASMKYVSDSIEDKLIELGFVKVDILA